MTVKNIITSATILYYSRKKLLPRDAVVRFLETNENGRITWESYATHLVYGKTILQFKPPKYRDLEITKPVTVLVQLRLVSNRSCSEAATFQYLPLPLQRGGKFTSMLRTSH